jgi:hypothetical protein
VTPVLIDHKQEAYRLALSQYKDRPNIMGAIYAFMEISQDIEDLLQTMFLRFNLDLAGSDGLDAIGQLLAVERFPIANEPEFFQFDVTPLDEGYRFFDGNGAPYRLIDDVYYRRALRAWTITMNSFGSINDLILSLSYLFDLPVSAIEITAHDRFQFDVTPLDEGYSLDWNYTEVSIHVYSELDVEDLSLYNYVTVSGSRLWPKVAGITYTLTHD